MLVSAKILCIVISSMGMHNSNFACKQMKHVVKYSQRYNVSPFVVTALIERESRWKWRARGTSGEVGLGQLMPQYVYPKISNKRLRVPRNNIRITAKTLSHWIRNYGKGNVLIGLCGYNGGKRCKGRNPLKRSMRYARKILSRSKRIKVRYYSFLVLGTR